MPADNQNPKGLLRRILWLGWIFKSIWKTQTFSLAFCLWSKDPINYQLIIEFHSEHWFWHMKAICGGCGESWAYSSDLCFSAAVSIACCFIEVFTLIWNRAYMHYRTVLINNSLFPEDLGNCSFDKELVMAKGVSFALLLNYSSCDCLWETITLWWKQEIPRTFSFLISQFSPSHPYLFPEIWYIYIFKNKTFWWKIAGLLKDTIRAYSKCLIRTNMLSLFLSFSLFIINPKFCTPSISPPWYTGRL